MESKPPAKSKTTRQRPAPTKRGQVHTPSVSTTLHDRIAARAYEIYERRIRQSPLDDWLQAEQEILGQQKTRNLDRPHRVGDASEEQD